MVAIICVLVMQLVLDAGALGVPLPCCLGCIFRIAGEALIWISTFFAILSGVIYIKQNKQFISDC